MTFTEFISKNTDNILGYFENDSESQVEEQYTSMVFFLEYLHTDNPELYKVANQLFWGSVIAAFLQSDRPKVHDEERGCEAEYYLDTPIAMALLDLSTPENELSASDVCDIIKSSGGILKIHPVTIEEMKTILARSPKTGLILEQESPMHAQEENYMHLRLRSYSLISRKNLNRKA